VTPPELHSAAGTLRGARAELSAQSGLGAGGLGADGAGSPGLSDAVSDFCLQAGAFADALAEAVAAGASRTDSAAESYARADHGSMRADG